MTGPRRMDGPANPNGSAAGVPPGATAPGSRTIIPLMPGVARPRGDRRVLMREAVIEVVHHLVLKAVPPGQRSPLFDQARDLLTEVIDLARPGETERLRAELAALEGAPAPEPGTALGGRR